MAIDATSDRPERCHVCGAAGQAVSLLASSSFHRSTGRRRDGMPRSQLWACRRCGALFRVSPPLSREEQQEYFDNAPYVVADKAEETRKRKRGMFEHLVRRTSSRFADLGRKARVIDFGCSYGHLGRMFLAAGWDVIGVDIAPSIVEMHRREGTFPAFATLDDDEIPDGWADVVTIIDSLYYVERPLAILELAHRKLANRGAVLLRMSNRVQYLRMAARLQKRHGKDLVARFEMDHNNYWSYRTARVVGRLAGFDRVVIRRREKGFWYPPVKKAAHWFTQALAAATGGVVNLATAFHAELWKDDSTERG